MTIAEDEVAYKLPPEIKLTEAGTEESLSDPTVPEPSPDVHVPEPQRPTAPPTRSEAGPNQKPLQASPGGDYQSP